MIPCGRVAKANRGLAQAVRLQTVSLFVWLRTAGVQHVREQRKRSVAFKRPEWQAVQAANKLHFEIADR